MNAAERTAVDQLWEDAVLTVLFEWTVPDPDVPGLDGEQLLTQIINEATAAMERLKAKGMIDTDGASA